MSGWRLGIHAGFFRREVEIAERSSLTLASRSSTDELRPDQYSIAFPRRYFVPRTVHRSQRTHHTFRSPAAPLASEPIPAFSS